MIKWTKDSIIKVLREFYDEQGYLPTSKQLDKIVGLPKRRTMRIICNMTYKELLDEYFTEPLYQRNDKYNSCKDKYYIEDFKKRYIELGRPNQKNYDLNRNDNMPSSQYIMKITGIKKWSELLDFCNLRKEEKELYCTVVCDFSNYEKVFEVCEQIYKILGEIK